jgi:hypothetical protein
MKLARTAVGLALFLTMDARTATAQTPTTCVQSWSEVARAKRGYDHYVILLSRCRTPVRCEVSSDRSPKPRRVVVAPRKQLKVLVFRGSPEPHFVPRVTCRTPPRRLPLTRHVPGIAP